MNIVWTRMYKKFETDLATPLMDKRLKAPTLKITLRENVRQMLVKATDLSNEYQAEQQLRITPTKKKVNIQISVFEMERTALHSEH